MIETYTKMSSNGKVGATGMIILFCGAIWHFALVLPLIMMGIGGLMATFALLAAASDQKS